MLNLHKVVGEPRSRELERTVSSAVQINYPKVSELSPGFRDRIRLDYEDKSSSKAQDHSMLGTAQSGDPKRSLLPKFQGVQQEHDLGASTGEFLSTRLGKNYKDHSGISFYHGIRSRPAQHELHQG